MSKADELRAKVRRLHDIEPDDTPTDTQEQPAPANRPRTKKVRRTVDLGPAHHAELDRWCMETAGQLGRARVTGQDVLRTLVARLLTDETLARKIRQDLAEDQ